MATDMAVVAPGIQRGSDLLLHKIGGLVMQRESAQGTQMETSPATTSIELVVGMMGEMSKGKGERILRMPAKSGMADEKEDAVTARALHLHLLSD